MVFLTESDYFVFNLFVGIIMVQSLTKKKKYVLENLAVFLICLMGISMFVVALNKSGSNGQTSTNIVPSAMGITNPVINASLQNNFVDSANSYPCYTNSTTFDSVTPITGTYSLSANAYTQAFWYNFPKNLSPREPMKCCIVLQSRHCMMRLMLAMVVVSQVIILWVTPK